MAANMGIKLMLHIKFSTTLWATEGPGCVVRVVNLFMGQQGTFNFEHFPAFVARVLEDIAMNSKMRLDLPLVEIFGTNFTLSKFSFFEHMFLGVLLDSHDTVSGVCASLLVASKDNSFIYLLMFSYLFVFTKASFMLHFGYFLQ